MILYTYKRRKEMTRRKMKTRKSIIVQNLILLALTVFASIVFCKNVEKIREETLAKERAWINATKVEYYMPYDVEKVENVIPLVTAISETSEVNETVISPKIVEVKPDETTETVDEAFEEDVKLLAQIGFHEAGVLLYSKNLSYEEGKQSIMLTMSVVIHRANCNLNGASTIRETLYSKDAKGRPQYASTTIKRVEEMQDIPQEFYDWAREILTNGPLGPSNLIYQAEFKQGIDVFEKIGNLYFCLDDISK